MKPEFDFDKYIWQIQFQPRKIFPSKEPSCHTTIDLLNRVLIVRKTDSITHIVSEQIYEISDADYEQLLPHTEIEKIQSFERKSAEELKWSDWGYRDGWWLDYSYFTHEVPPRIDGTLGRIYKENPLEEIVNWILRTFSETELWL